MAKKSKPQAEGFLKVSTSLLPKGKCEMIAFYNANEFMHKGKLIKDAYIVCDKEDTKLIHGKIMVFLIDGFFALRILNLDADGTWWLAAPSGASEPIKMTKKDAKRFVFGGVLHIFDMTKILHNNYMKK